MSPTTTVILSTFPPLRCGIARYAAQHAEYLRRQGRSVVTVGLPGSEADAVVDALGGRKPLDVLDAVRQLGLQPRDCSLAIHWHDLHYFCGGFSERLPTALALARLFGSFAETEVVCHETYPPLKATSLPRAMLRALYRALRRRAWLKAATLAFHSQAERRRAEQAHGGLFPEAKVVLRGHGAFLFRYRDVDQPTARRELGIEPEPMLFLCTGFLSEHKGFDTALRAFRQVRSPCARLAVVGSLREDTPQGQDYVSLLRALAAEDDRVQFRERFLSDEEYDTWNAAADVVVAPYTQAFSSSVVARAKLFGKPVIVTDVGGLVDQTGPEDWVVSSPEGVADAMQQAIEARPCA